MERLHFFLLLLTVVCICGGSLASTECNLKEYITCARHLQHMRRSSACSHLESSQYCLTSLLSVCGFHSNQTSYLCEGISEEKSRCGILDGSHQAPLVSVWDVPSECGPYNAITKCVNDHCQPGGPGFSFMDSRNYPQPRPSKCVSDGFDACVRPVMEVTKVNKESCINVPKAKNCYLDQMDRCGGGGEERIVVDLILAAFARHIKACKANNFPFTRDGGMCVPNPEDQFSLDTSGLKMPVTRRTKEVCKRVASLEKRLEAYEVKCNASDFNRNIVGDLRGILMAPTLECYKEGLLKNNNGFKGQAHCPLIIAALILSSLVWRGQQWMG